MPSLVTTYKTFEVSSDSGGALSGYANVFHFLDWHNDIIAPGAFLQDIPRFVAKGFVGGIGHDHKNPIGKPTRLFEDSRGLYMDASLDDSPEATRARQKVADGIIKHFSVGVVPLQARRLNEKQIHEYWAKAGWTPSEEERMRSADPDGATLIKRARILEVSPVALPANDHSDIVSYKAFGGGLDDLRRRVEVLEKKFASASCAVDVNEDEIGKLLEGFRNFLGDR